MTQPPALRIDVTIAGTTTRLCWTRVPSTREVLAELVRRAPLVVEAGPDGLAAVLDLAGLLAPAGPITMR